MDLERLKTGIKDYNLTSICSFFVWYFPRFSMSFSLRFTEKKHTISIYVLVRYNQGTYQGNQGVIQGTIVIGWRNSKNYLLLHSIDRRCRDGWRCARWPRWERRGYLPEIMCYLLIWGASLHNSGIKSNKRTLLFLFFLPFAIILIHYPLHI